MQTKLSLEKVTTARYWTKQAKECYYRGCKCFGCSMGTFSFTSSTQKVYDESICFRIS